MLLPIWFTLANTRYCTPSTSNVSTTSIKDWIFWYPYKVGVNLFRWSSNIRGQTSKWVLFTAKRDPKALQDQSSPTSSSLKFCCRHSDNVDDEGLNSADASGMPILGQEKLSTCWEDCVLQLEHTTIDFQEPAQHFPSCLTVSNINIRNSWARLHRCQLWA